MKRVKTKPKNRDKKLIEKSSLEAIEYCYTLTQAILRCDFGFSNEQIEKFRQKLDHYSGYLRDGNVTYKEILDIIKSKQEEA